MRIGFQKLGASGQALLIKDRLGGIDKLDPIFSQLLEEIIKRWIL